MSDFIEMDDISISPRHSDGGLKSTRMRTHTSALIERVEVITCGARRRWHASEKRAIVLESLAPGVVVSAVCRQHGISSRQLSPWRQEMREGKLGDPRPPFLQFAEAVVAEPPIIRPLPRLLPSGAPDQAD